METSSFQNAAPERFAMLVRVVVSLASPEKSVKSRMRGVLELRE